VCCAFRKNGTASPVSASICAAVAVLPPGALISESTWSPSHGPAQDVQAVPRAGELAAGAHQHAAAERVVAVLLEGAAAL
jgi:hypothetical protein